MTATQLVLFDYQQLDAETRIVVQQRTSEIRERVDNIKRNTIEIGQKLREVKARLKHGQFGAWLEMEFTWSEDTAENLIRVAALVEQNPKISEFEDNFARSALYLLAAPSTPDEARAEAIERAEAGEAITHKRAKEIVDEHKPAPPDEVRRSDGLTDAEWVEQKMEILKQKLPPPDAGTMQSTAPVPEMKLRPRPEEDPKPAPPPQKLDMSQTVAPDTVITIRIKNDPRYDVRPVLISMGNDGQPPTVLKSASIKTLLDELRVLLESPKTEIIGDDIPEATPEWLEQE